MFFFYIVNQTIEVKYHRYLTGSLFKKVTKKLDIYSQLSEET
jgi:hypothetical protein